MNTPRNKCPASNGFQLLRGRGIRTAAGQASARLSNIPLARAAQGLQSHLTCLHMPFLLKNTFCHPLPPHLSFLRLPILYTISWALLFLFPSEQFFLRTCTEAQNLSKLGNLGTRQPGAGQTQKGEGSTSGSSLPRVVRAKSTMRGPPWSEQCGSYKSKMG